MSSIDFATHAQEWVAAWDAHGKVRRVLAHYSDDIQCGTEAAAS